MTHTLESILEQSRPELPPGLSDRVLAAIERAAMERLRFRTRVVSWGAFASLAGFFVSLAVAGDSFLSSDFWQISSLLFSDLSLVLEYSGEFFSSLGETFPAASAALLLTPLFSYVALLLLRSEYREHELQLAQFRFHTAH